MFDYEITFLVDPETLTDAAIDALYDAHDCLAGGRPHGGSFVTLTVDARNAEAAINSGWMTLRQHGLRVLDVDRDLVDVAEIATRTNSTRQAVHNWINGARRDGFPPVFTDAGKGLWLWGEVQAWALEQGIHVEDADMRYPSRDDHDRGSLLVRNHWDATLRPGLHTKRPGSRSTHRGTEWEDLFVAVLHATQEQSVDIIDHRHQYTPFFEKMNPERAHRKHPAHA